MIACRKINSPLCSITLVNEDLVDPILVLPRTSLNQVIKRTRASAVMTHVREAIVTNRT